MRNPVWYVEGFTSSGKLESDGKRSWPKAEMTNPSGMHSISPFSCPPPPLFSVFGGTAVAITLLYMAPFTQVCGAAVWTCTCQNTSDGKAATGWSFWHIIFILLHIERLQLCLFVSSSLCCDIWSLAVFPIKFTGMFGLILTFRTGAQPHWIDV